MDAEAFPGHPLRAGFVTVAERKGLPLRDIQRQTRHKSIDTSKGRLRESEAWHDNASQAVFDDFTDEPSS